MHSKLEDISSTCLQHLFETKTRTRIQNSLTFLPLLSKHWRHKKCLFDMHIFVFESYTTSEELWRILTRHNSKLQIVSVWSGLKFIHTTIYSIIVVLRNPLFLICQRVWWKFCMQSQDKLVLIFFTLNAPFTSFCSIFSFYWKKKNSINMSVYD